MNKRKAICDISVEPNSKQIKVTNNCVNMLDGIEFMDFDDEFTLNEETADKKVSTERNYGIQQNSHNDRDQLLDLSKWKRCVVESFQRDAKNNDLIIIGYEDQTMHSESQTANIVNNKPMKCRFQQSWSQCRIEIGDVVSIMAEWNDKFQSYCITNAAGLAVIRPDFLVSGTTVVGGLFCMRKAVLQDRFKGIGTDNKIMTIGSIVHELFQVVLRRRLMTRELIQGVAEQMLADGGLAQNLYASNMKTSEARQEFDGFIEKIYEFMQRYVNCNTKTAPNTDKVECFKGVIDSIEDIEENIWVPRLGLKGKIDATVKVRLHSQTNGESHYMPLELKTGRASFSPEHTGQLIIYQMMMSSIADPAIDSGLLLYLREGVMREVKATHNERRDLLILRNEISYFLTKQHEQILKIGQENRYNEMNGTSNEDYITELMRASCVSELPEPINRINVCSNCPYNILCSVYLNQDAKTLSSLDKNHPMREIATLTTVHLSDAHIDYFCHWVGLMALEDQENKKLNPNKTLWLESPEQRQKCGRSVFDLKLNPKVDEEKSTGYVHEFYTNVLDLTSYDFDVGNYLIVSTRKRIAIAAGPVISCTEKTITLILDRNLCDRYLNESFIIDKYESQTNTTFNMSNLGALLDDTDASERLRKIVIDRVEPTFTKTLPKIITTSGKSILMDLNQNQRTAILKALTANEYLLLKGLPGTGKTQTLTALIRLLVLMNKSVLITCHTHSAVDNLLLRLRKSDDQIRFMRLGASKRIHRELKDCSEEFYTSKCETSDELSNIYKEFDVIGVTCLGSGHPLLTQRQFDVCLVDEATQVFQSTVLRPLFSAKKIILVGDPDQLPPIIRSSVARKLGADESLFARLDSSCATVALTLQYRMNKTIMKVANDLTYHGTLACANDKVANATFQAKTSTKIKWMQRTLSTHIDQSVIFLNTGNVANINKSLSDKILRTETQSALLSPSKIKRRNIYTNNSEVAIILAIIKELKIMNITSKMIGVIAPYALQVDLLKKYIEKHFDRDIEVNTVDQYQGRDKEIIIYSGTRTGNEMKSVENGKINQILDDHRRLTVAITRAKHKLIIIGDTVSLEGYRPFKMLITGLSKMNKINLVDQQHGFNWSALLSIFDSK